MEKEWEGTSKGTVGQFKVFVFLIRYLGVYPAYWLSGLVGIYFCVFSPSTTKPLYYYFRKRRQQSLFKSCISIYRNYYVFGQILIDKVAIGIGYRDKFSYNFDGVEHLQKLIDGESGGILISAHVGNFEVAKFFFHDFNNKRNINIVITDVEHAHIKSYFENISQKTNLNIIVIKDDMSHAFEISTAINRGELVCITGDRYYELSKTFTTEFLGATAKFPAGPFQIATRLQTPVLFVYVMREPNKHYHLFAKPVEVIRRDDKALLKSYLDDLEGMLNRYPEQWFNYYKFWEEQKH